jgi:uncharacterized Zn finger protein (UPF0148 family)
MPLEIPGTSIRLPVKEGVQECPKCRRSYANPIIKQDKQGNISWFCPFCGSSVNEPIEPKKPEKPNTLRSKK